jgi:Holliday junction resolvase RusA-like endonuclease
MASKVKFEIDMLPVTENNAVRMTRRGGYKTQDYKDWEEYVLLTVKEKEIDVSEWYKAQVVCHFPLYYKNGNIRKKDAHNRIKYAVDTLLHNKVIDSKGNRIDDKRIIKGRWEKVEDDKEWVEIIFECVK